MSIAGVLSGNRVTSSPGRRFSLALVQSFQHGNGSAQCVMFFLTFDVADVVWQSFLIERKNTVLILPRERL